MLWIMIISLLAVSCAGTIKIGATVANEKPSILYLKIFRTPELEGSSTTTIRYCSEDITIYPVIAVVDKNGYQEIELASDAVMTLSRYDGQKEIIYTRDATLAKGSGDMGYLTSVFRITPEKDKETYEISASVSDGKDSAYKKTRLELMRISCVKNDIEIIVKNSQTGKLMGDTIVKVGEYVKKTNINGIARFPGLEQGDYTIIIKKQGYKTISANIALHDDLKRTYTMKTTHERSLDLPAISVYDMENKNIYDNEKIKISFSVNSPYPAECILISKKDSNKGYRVLETIEDIKDTSRHTFTHNLGPGKHTLKIRCSNSDGISNSRKYIVEVKRLTIEKDIVKEKKEDKKRKHLFDINGEMVYQDQDTISVRIGLLNFGEEAAVTAHVFYSIRSKKGHVYQDDEYIEVGGQKEIIREFDISGYEPGNYSIYLNLEYDGQVEPAQSVLEFSIQERRDRQKTIPLALSAPVIIIIIILLVKIVLAKKRQ